MKKCLLWPLTKFKLKFIREVSFFIVYDSLKSFLTLWIVGPICDKNADDKQLQGQVYTQDTTHEKNEKSKHNSM